MINLFYRAISLTLISLCFAATAQADIDSALNWLESRESADGVYRPTDIALRPDTHVEVLLTARALSVTERFTQSSQAALTDVDQTLSSVARSAFVRLEEGRSAADQFALLFDNQQADGGFPSHIGHQSEPLTTAWAVRALERAGRGRQTETTRALSFLLGSQLADGGWPAAAGGTGSAYVTASVALALQPLANQFDLTTALSGAAAYLRASRQTNNSWGEAFQTGLAIEAMLALALDRNEIELSVTALEAQQAGNGSFNDDGFETAIALRALNAWAQPVTEPLLAGLTGRVLSADSDLPLVGAELSLSGPGAATLNSNNRGELNSTSLLAGAYTATLSFPGFRNVDFELTLVDGRVNQLGDIRMYPGGSQGSDLGTIRGVVTDRDTGLALVGARVFIEGTSNEVTTDDQGRYQFLQLPPGEVRIGAETTGYCTVRADATVVPLSPLELSFRLWELAQPIGFARVRGVATNADDDTPLEGVLIEVLEGSTLFSATTDVNGEYELNIDVNDNVSITASITGFDSVSVDTLLTTNQVFEFSPSMYAESTTPPGANKSSITGTVVNQANRQPISNALVVVTDPSGQQAVRSDTSGNFTVTDLTGPTVELAFSADAFDPATLLVPVLPLEDRQIGQVGLKPTALDFYFPDLRITGSSLVETDPDLFTTTSELVVEVVNQGTSNTTQDFTVIAFIDANGDGEFADGVEPIIGQTRAVEDLPIGSATQVNVAINAQLTFRDAPVALLVDYEQEVPEQNEDNNVGSTLLGCRVTPAFIGNENVFEAWNWEGWSVNPNVNSVNAVPAVGQLTDDNGDGVINQYDIPDIVVSVGARGSVAPGQTILVALSGDDGRELWTSSPRRLSHFSGPALGDIDNDGIAEIIVMSGYREEIIAFEHDGTIKWRTAGTGPGIPAVLIPPPPFVYDMPVIVNLEGDNEAEIIHGRRAYRGLTGELLWEGEFDGGGGDLNLDANKTFSAAGIAADINLDGVMEVVAGRTAYDFEGRAIWHRDDIDPSLGTDAVGDVVGSSGYNAVGNFDIDDFAEIVLTINDRMYLLEHTGDTIWGPVRAPDFGELGAPSVADIDDDGLPEIIISSNTRLTVFETDGTVKWTFTISDESGVTSATVFDFENDGLLELIHVDEQDFRILDALTGTLLYETRHTSQTVFEYPVVADVDGDREAEIIITGWDQDGQVTTPGVRVFKARNGAWADAGSVWGSHAFHINEVNEDSTVPLLETPSWLTHNTYRVQRSPLPDPLGLPDFTVGDLRLIDQGPGLDPIVQVRVGNAGPVDAHEPPFIGVYRGDPNQGGVLLAERRLDTLSPARFQIVDLGEVSTAGTGALFAVIDQRERARECREINNSRSIPFTATNARGQLQLTSDALSYTPGETVVITSTVTNSGELAANYFVELQIEDANGNSTDTLDGLSFADVGSTQSAALQSDWLTAGVLGGTYTVTGQLFNEAGELVDTATVSVAIVGAISGPAGAVRLVSDLAEYQPGQNVTLSFRAQNTSDNEVIRLPEVLIAVTGPNGFSQQRTFVLNDLFPSTIFEGQLLLESAAAPGSYSATATLRSALTGTDYDTDDALFVRVDDPSADLFGVVDAATLQLMAGDPQTCLYTARVQGPAQAGVVLRQRLVALDAEVVVSERSITTDLAPGSDFVDSQAVDTGLLQAGIYACTLEAAQGSGWRVLDSAAFTVVALGAPGVTVDPVAGLVTSEEGQNATFTVVLDTPPVSDVVIGFAASDPNEWGLAQPQVTFTTADWSIPKTITVFGLDDAAVDGTQVGTIAVTINQTTDPDYASIDPADVSISNLDNDSAAINVSPLNLSTSETGTTASFEVQLSAAPSADVVIDLNSSDTGEWTVMPAQLTFTAADWTQPQTVTVTGVDDALLDGTQTGLIVVEPAQSADPQYLDLDGDDVAVSNLDDEQAQVIVSPTTVTTSESGVSGQFVVTLSAAPSADVVVPLGGVDASEWELLATEVRLDSGNWDSGVAVVISPVDDPVADGTQSATLALSPAQSADAAFNGVDPADVTLINLDDDSAQILVTPTSGLIVDENGASDTFTVVLSQQPTADVAIAISVADATEFDVAPLGLTFTDSDWDIPQVVTVTGVDDADQDGNVLGLISLEPAVSADGNYDGRDPQDVTVTNIDNETVQLVVTPNAAIITDENGTSVTLSVSVNAAPTAEVTLNLVNPDATEWSLSATSVVFDSANWQTPQTVTVTGVDDAVIDGDISDTLVLQPLQSGDLRFAGLDPTDLPMVNQDDDAPIGPPPSIVLMPIDMTTSEDGATGRFSVDVTGSLQTGSQTVLAVTSSDEGEVTVTPATLTFVANKMPQLITLTGIDDTEIDGSQTVTLTVAVQSSTDPQAAAMASQTLTAVNSDNDGAVVPIPLDRWAMVLLVLLMVCMAAHFHSTSAARLLHRQAKSP